ncbi:MAG TPA: hypothetical protein PLG02_10585 [Methylotenera sp.]|nr:hypothetical protein [Methylotenera sp.]
MPTIWYNGFLVNLALDNNTAIEFSITPFVQCRNNIGIIRTGHECAALYDQIAYRSQSIKQDGIVEAEWLKLCDQKRYEYLSYVHGYNRILSFINKKIHFTDALYSRRAYNMILNVMRCETHREVLESIMEKRTFRTFEEQFDAGKKDEND